MRIAFFTQDQVETVVDLLHEMSGHYNDGLASDRSKIQQNLIENILGPQSGVRLLLALDGQRAVGLASIAILYPAMRERAQLHLKELYVVASHRSQGIGTSLLRHVAEYALATNCMRLDWTVEHSNERALAFYKRLGAKPAPEKVYFRVTGDDLALLSSQKDGARDAG
jgi:ribosomal protein S18 acetylase RimI-like enzyme